MNARPIAHDILSFRARQHGEHGHAAQIAALHLVCGIDLERALGGGEVERLQAAQRLGRLIERERLRGARRHWSYDLNRHIALKQALDRLQRSGGGDARARRMAVGSHDT